MAIEFSIKKSFSQFALDISAELPLGITGIFGPSGSGKTTLLQCLAGFLTPDSGAVSVLGKSIFASEAGVSIPIEKRNIGVVLQDTLLFPPLNVRQNIVYGQSRESDSKHFDEIIALLDLGRLLGRDVCFLSGGEKQRVALARALLARPAVLLLDEPVSSVDMKARFQILKYLRDIFTRWQVPIIYVSHSTAEILYLAQQVLCLEAGQKKAFGPTEKILLNPALFDSPEEVFENSYELAIMQNRIDERMVILDFGGQPLQVPFTLDVIRPRLRVSLKANDIILATEKVAGLSARNVIPAELVDLKTANGLCRVYAQVGTCRCFVDVTAAAARELKLQPGQQVYLIIKTRSIVVID